MKKMFTALFLGVLIYTFITFAFKPQCSPIVGTSMFPNIQHNDTCITYEKWFFNDLQIERGDIVIISYRNKFLIKRIVAIPGDAIVITDGVLIINGQLEDTTHLLLGQTSGDVGITLGADEYYVLGDNRVLSKDSRTFGPVPRSNILGKVFARWRNPIKI